MGTPLYKCPCANCDQLHANHPSEECEMWIKTKGDEMTLLNDITAKIVECGNQRKYYKVWVSGPHAPGYLRLGHAWKTKSGAQRAMLEHMKKYNLRGYIGLSRNENDSEIEN